jgi:DNA-binding NtrC family response regulator
VEEAVERLGGHGAVAVAARIVASAGAGVEDAVLGGTFRGDLITACACCRSRSRCCASVRRTSCRSRIISWPRRRPWSRAAELARDAAAALRDYAWLGNVRGSRMRSARAFDAAPRGRRPRVGHLPTEIPEAPALEPDRVVARRPTPDEVGGATSRRRSAMRAATRPRARLLGISRKALWEKRKRYGLE